MRPFAFLLAYSLTPTLAWADVPPPDDADGDGLPDVDDAAPHDCDGDHDGVPDSVERGLTAPIGGSFGGPCFVADADPSTTTSPTDEDSDGGGLDDGLEDRNHDGQVDDYETDPNLAEDDLDSDADGWPDAVEGTGNHDSDGLTDNLDPDSDGDGLADKLEDVADWDGDGVIGLLDTDSDDDGIPDGLDGVTDPDLDGRPAYGDLDSDDDGLPDAQEGAADFDGDTLPNHVDTNSDEDGATDAQEGFADADCDGHPDFLDVYEDDGFCDTDIPRGDIDDSDFGEPFQPVTVADPKAYACGCDDASMAPVSLGLLGALALLRRRARR